MVQVAASNDNFIYLQFQGGISECLFYIILSIGDVFRIILFSFHI